MAGGRAPVAGASLPAVMSRCHTGDDYLLKLALALLVMLPVLVIAKVSVVQPPLRLVKVISPKTVPSPPRLDCDVPLLIVTVADPVNVPADLVTVTVNVLPALTALPYVSVRLILPLNVVPLPVTEVYVHVK
jgi:hypothetical protein